MKRLFIPLFSALLLTGIGQIPLTAQNAVVVASPSPNDHNREGFWINIGLGYGTLGCDRCDDEREGGFGGGLSLGGTLSDQWLLGGGTNGWTKAEDGVTRRVSTLTTLARFYTSATGGFFLIGGVGVGVSLTVRENSACGCELSDSETGFATLIGLGYDVRVGGNVSLTPFFNGFTVNSEDITANVGEIGVGVTIH